jgi:hypothetical protein
MIIRFNYKENRKPFEVFIDETIPMLQIQYSLFPVREVFICHTKDSEGEQGLILEDFGARLKGGADADVESVELIDSRNNRLMAKITTDVKDVYYRTFIYNSDVGLVHQESVSIRLKQGNKPIIDEMHEEIICSPDCPFLENGVCKFTMEELDEINGVLLASTTCVMECDAAFRNLQLRESYMKAFNKVAAREI